LRWRSLFALSLRAIQRKTQARTGQHASGTLGKAEAAKKAKEEATPKHTADVAAKHKPRPIWISSATSATRRWSSFLRHASHQSRAFDVPTSLVDLMKATVPQMPHVIKESVKKSRDCLMRYESADVLSPEQAL
jgi:hypothetical protein